MKLEGGEQLRRALLKKQGEFLEEMARALPEEANALASAAQATVPRASGELASSQVVTSDVKPGRVKAVVAYTDEKAAAVHEGVHGRTHHQDTRGFKWFEKVLHAFEGGFAERIAARLRRIVGG